MLKEISLVSLLCESSSWSLPMNLGIQSKNQTGYQNTSDGNSDAFLLSEQHSTHTHSGDKQTTQLQVQCYEAIAVMHSAVRRKFEIVTIKAIKAMHWIQFSEKLQLATSHVPAYFYQVTDH